MKIMRTMIQSLAFLSLVASAAVPVSGTALVGEVGINKLRLTNKGAYVIKKVILKWKRPNDNKHYSRNEMRLKKSMAGVTISNAGDDRMNSGDVMRVDLDKIFINRRNKARPILGDHVWMVVHIEMGDVSSCRKSDHDVFSERAGRMRAYQVAGTTLNNNRCKRKELIDLT